ncbi:MAG TPA: hypothetical protein PKH98_02885, partial [Candidatus Omnitrophota bacterium]|nr:hypothetical protein [Candidatus Omnitrophota bacterium]
YDPVTKSLVPRKYFSGGGDFTNLQLSKVTDLAMVSKLATLGAMLLLISGILLSPNNKILEVKNSNAIKMEDNLKPTSINNVNISKLTQYINQNFGIIGGVEESQIRRSLEISNLPEYQDFVAATYKILEKIGIKDKVPILFLEGYDNPNMAFALQEAGIIMVGAGIFKNLTLQEKIALLAPKIAHEAVHIQYPHLSILEQEALAYEKTAEALDLFNGEPGIITITENISRAFRAIVDNPSEILRTLRAKSLGPINYDDISIQGSEGTIKLYNMVNKKRMDFKFNTGLVKKMDSVSDSKDNAMKTDELEILSPQEAREYIYINFSEELSKNQQRALSEEKALIENVRLMPNQRSIILSKQHIHVPTLHYAVTDAKQQNPILVSTGANPCFIVIIWDKEKKIGFLAHLHYLSKPTDFINFALEKMQSRLDSQSIDKADLEVTLIGGRSNNVPNKHRLNKEFINQGIFNVKDMGDIEEGSTRVVYTGALDPRTGEIFNVLQPLHKMVVPEKSPESKLIPFDLTDVRGLGGDQAMMTEQEAREVINHIENVLIHQMIRKPAEDVLKILNELKELLIKIKAFPDPIYDDNYSDLKGYKISYLEKSIAEQEKAVLFELLVKNISKQNGRPFLDITAWQASPFVSAEGEKLDSGDLVGHATNFETIYNIIFESSGVIRAQGDEPIYVGGHGQGQSARVRILHKPGLIHIVWSQDSLAKENIYRRKSLGEITFDQDMPLRLAIAPSKCHIWQSMLSILEAKNEELTFEKKQKIAFALGYDRYDALVSELTPFIDNVFKISSVDVADKAIVGKEQAPGGIDLNPDKFQIEKKGDGVEFNWPTDPKALENIQINGLVPVIINITPI